jgi:hypothetical protein
VRFSAFSLEKPSCPKEKRQAQSYGQDPMATAKYKLLYIQAAKRFLALVRFT